MADGPAEGLRLIDALAAGGELDDTSISIPRAPPSCAGSSETTRPPRPIRARWSSPPTRSSAASWSVA